MPSVLSDPMEPAEVMWACGQDRSQTFPQGSVPGMFVLEKTLGHWREYTFCLPWQHPGILPEELLSRPQASPSPTSLKKLMDYNHFCSFWTSPTAILGLSVQAASVKPSSACLAAKVFPDGQLECPDNPPFPIGRMEGCNGCNEHAQGQENDLDGGP